MVAVTIKAAPHVLGSPSQARAAHEASTARAARAGRGNRSPAKQPHLRQQGKVGLITTSLQTLNFTDEIVAIPFASSINEQFTTSLQQQYFEAAAYVRLLNIGMKAKNES